MFDRNADDVDISQDQFGNLVLSQSYDGANSPDRVVLSPRMMREVVTYIAERMDLRRIVEEGLREAPSVYSHPTTAGGGG